MRDNRLSIGIVTFAHPPVYGTSKDRERDAFAEYDSLCRFLEDQGYDVVRPLDELRRGSNDVVFGISSSADLDFCINYMKKSMVDCTVVYLCQWTRVPLVSALVKEVDVPAALYASTDDRWVGEVTATAVSASVLEMPASQNCRLLARFRDAEREDMLTWLRGIGALQAMKTYRLMSWGGQYGADIPYTRSDQAMLESSFVKEIITEQEICLIKEAERILKDQPERIEGFVRWLYDHGTEVSYDQNMLNEEVLKFQIAQYFAAKDRLLEKEEERISGVSIKCHFEVSTECVGCTECLIPGFLPFGFDSEGAKPIVPVACEGDLNGLVSSMLLHTLKPDIPPLFGDMITYKKEYILLRNCGAASVYWARRSNSPGETLPGVKLLPNMHGKSGCSVYFNTPPGEEITFARLFRVDGSFHMYLGRGMVYEKEVENTQGITWPHTRIYFNSDHCLVYKTSPCNHGCITEGDVTREIEVFCRYAGVKVVRCDSDLSMRAYLTQGSIY